MKITDTLTDAAVLAEVGRRIQRTRLARNVTQAHLATEAGISVPTLQRLEAGTSVQWVSLLRTLRALGLLGNLEAAIAEPGVRPIELLEHAGRTRQRASAERTNSGAEPWTWQED